MINKECNHILIDVKMKDFYSNANIAVRIGSSDDRNLIFEVTFCLIDHIVQLF